MIGPMQIRIGSLVGLWFLGQSAADGLTFSLSESVKFFKSF